MSFHLSRSFLSLSLSSEALLFSFLSIIVLLRFGGFFLLRLSLHVSSGLGFRFTPDSALLIMLSSSDWVCDASEFIAEK